MQAKKWLKSFFLHALKFFVCRVWKFLFLDVYFWYYIVWAFSFFPWAIWFLYFACLSKLRSHLFVQVYADLHRNKKDSFCSHFGHTKIKIFPNCRNLYHISLEAHYVACSQMYQQRHEGWILPQRNIRQIYDLFKKGGELEKK